MKVKFNLDKAIQYPFANEQSLQRLGILLLLFAVVFGPLVLISADLDLVGYETPSYNNTLGENPYAGFSDTLLGGAFLYTMVASTAFMFYYYGYIVSIVRGVIDGEESLPEHSAAHFTPGFKLFGAVFIVMIALLIVFGALVFVLFGPAGLTGFSEGATVVAAIGFILLSIGAFLSIGFFVYPAVLYYISVDNSLSKAINPKHIWALIRVYALELLAVAGLLILATIAISILMSILQFIPYVGPILSTMGSAAIGVVSIVFYGDIFKQIYQQQHELQTDQETTA